MSLEERFAKVKSPNLESQKHTAVVLTSVEDTLRDQKTKFTPTAYFSALLALLKQATSSGNGSTQNDLLTSAVYLLDIVTSHVPHPLLRAQYSKIISVLGPVLSRRENDAPLIRSSLGCLESLLLAQDATAWSLPSTQTSPRQAVGAILVLALDGRPKVRKRALETLTTVLQNPPPGPAIDHPAAELCAVWTSNNLRTAVGAADQSRKQRSHGDDNTYQAVIHALQLTKIIANASRGWPSKNIEQLCELLLSISRSRNEFLVLNAFQVFEVILEGMSDEVASSKLQRLLEAIIELKPAHNDVQVLPPWIAILSRGYQLAGQLEPKETFAKLPELVEIVAEFLTVSSHNVRVSASECLISFFANCIPSAVILDPSIYDEKILERVATKTNSFLGVKYQSAWREVFKSLSALFDSLRWRGDPFLLPVVQTVGGLRGNDAFQGKKEADDVLGSAIRNLGPQPILSVLPHNLIRPSKNQPGRAWLLPLLRDHVSNTNLSHFKSDLVPLGEAMCERVLAAGKNKTADTKVFETVVQQVWASFPGYCDLPLDLKDAFDQPLAEMISNILYKQTELRVDLSRGLQNLVESNQAILESDEADEELQVERRTTKAQAGENIRYLAQFASNILAVLFNVYSETQPQSRAYILQCINAYLSITPERDLVDTFERVSTLFQSSLPTESDKEPDQRSDKSGLPPTSHTLLDLIVALSLHLPRTSFGALFTLASTLLTSPIISKSSPQLLKKAYKIIPRLASSPAGLAALNDRTSSLQSLILSTGDQTPVPARRDRLLAIQTIISTLPPTDLHFVPSILSEVVLACKESNKNARAAAFDVLVSCAQALSNDSLPTGITIRNHLVPHMAPTAPDAPARLEEIFTMVSAGLAGVAPHMVAASITALARLLFEFHERLEEPSQREISDTVSMFLQSNNREIVRAVLGFVKVLVVIPTGSDAGEERLKLGLQTMTPSLMLWSKENKGRLRVKVRDIFDRCIRRFGAETVESWADGEERKMITNIRKRRERSRRKKKDAADGEEEAGEQELPARRYDNEFDQAVYGGSDEDELVDDDASEIEGGSDDGDDTMSGISFRTPSQKQNPGKRKGRQAEHEQYIVQDASDDEPLDLLDAGARASVTSRRAVRFAGARNETGKSRKAKVNEDGKLVFIDDDRRHQTASHRGEADRGNATGDVDGDIAMGGAGDGGAVDAYVDAITNPDAVRRGQRGRLKVKSGAVKPSGSTHIREDVEVTEDEAREVGRKLHRAGQGKGGRDGKNVKGVKPQQARRGLGVEKRRGGRDGGGGGGSGRGTAGFKRKVAGQVGGAGGGTGRRHGGWHHGGRRK